MLAALVIGGVAWKGRADSRASMAETEAHHAQERWWDRFTWIVGVSADHLPFQSRVGSVAELLRQAAQMQAPELVESARAYLDYLADLGDTPGVADGPVED